MEPLGKRLERFRLAAGFKSQNALFKASGVGQKVIWAIESGETPNPRRDTLEKLAAVLNVPIQVLINGQDPQSSLHWFWAARLAQLDSTELPKLQNAPGLRRIAWTLTRLLSWMPIEEIAARTELEADFLTELSNERGYATKPLMDRLTERLDLPPNWLFAGDTGPLDEVLQRVMQHHRIGQYLRAIDHAIQANVPPELIDQYITLLESRKPSAE